MSHPETTACCRCSDDGSRHPNAILFNILSQSQRSAEPGSTPTPAPRCHCAMLRSVRLATPAETSAEASGVLVKTLRFVRGLPAFQQLPLQDRLSLLRGGWAPVFILGLAQERVHFQVTDAPAASMLKRILLEGQESRGPADWAGPEGAGSEGAGSRQARPTLAAVHKLKACLHKLWSLDLSPKEYAYLKGAVLFNPGKGQSQRTCHSDVIVFWNSAALSLLA